MNKLLNRLRASLENAPLPPSGPGQDEALEAYKDELEARWQEFVHRARVHEMLKCLQSEHNKLQVLRDNIDMEELIPEEREDQDGLDFDESQSVNLQNEDTRSRRGTASSKNLIRKSLAESGVKKSSMAIEIFKNKNVMTDEEFEKILELCEDKMERQALREAFAEKKNRDKYLHNASERRQMLYDFINSEFFGKFMLVTIITSICGIFLLTFETISMRYAYALMILDSCIIAIFVVEALFKITIYKLDYFKRVWNLLDMLIIVVYLVEVIVELTTKTLAVSSEISTNIWFKLLKSLRALRLLRIIKFLPNLQVVLLTVFQSMLSMGSIAVLMVLFIFVFAVMGRGLFYEHSPVHFGTIFKAALTLFQLLTLDDWFELLDPVRHNAKNRAIDNSNQYWLMFAYLFCYLVIEFFVFLNLFVAVLVDNFQLTLADAEIRRKKEELMFLLEQQKFDERNKLHLNEEVEDEEITNNDDAMHPDKLELNVEEYFPIQKGSKDAQLYSDIFKDFTSLDFERFLWKRRNTLLNMIIDQGITAQQETWTYDKMGKNLLDEEAKLKEEKKKKKAEKKAAKASAGADKEKVQKKPPGLDPFD